MLDQRQNFVIEPHDPGYRAFQDLQGLVLIGIQHRRCVDENGELVWRTLYAQTLSKKLRKKAKRQVQARKKALRAGKRLKPLRSLFN